MLQTMPLQKICSSELNRKCAGKKEAGKKRLGGKKEAGTERHLVIHYYVTRNYKLLRWITNRDRKRTNLLATKLTSN